MGDEMYHILTMVVVKSLYTFVKTFRIAAFTVYKLYLNKINTKEKPSYARDQNISYNGVEFPEQCSEGPHSKDGVRLLGAEPFPLSCTPHTGQGRVMLQAWYAASTSKSASLQFNKPWTQARLPLGSRKTN